MKKILPYLFLMSFLTGNVLAGTKAEKEKTSGKQKGEISQFLPDGFISATNRADPASRLPLEIRCKKDESGMVLVPNGWFLMGSDFDEDEKPLLSVYLDDYWIDKYEVTFAKYDRFCEATGRKKPSSNKWGRGNKPVINISWHDAAAYAKWAGKRLPTEAEWEKAARGIDGREYPWGDELTDANEIPKANYDGYNYKRSEHHGVGKEDGYAFTSPVGSYQHAISPYGCFDMAGNVWEWVYDIYGPYGDNTENPKGPVKGNSRVMRGGSWANCAYSMRSANRNKHGPKYGNCNLGFRCAISPPQSFIEETSRKRKAEKIKEVSEEKPGEIIVQPVNIETRYGQNISGETANLSLILGDKYLGQKKYGITFAFEKSAPEEIEIRDVCETGKEGKKNAKMGENTKRKLEFACSLVNYLRSYNNEGKTFSQIMNLRADEYASERSSLLSSANLAGTLEQLGESAGYNLATGQPLTKSLLEDAAKNYAIKTLDDIVTVYSIKSNSSSDRIMSEIMKTLVDAWLSNKSEPKNPEEEFIIDLRASFLIQSISGEKYLKEIKEIVENKNYFNNPTDYKEIEYFYSQFRDGWTKGGVLKGWRKLEDENFDRQVGRGIGKALAGKYLPSEVRGGMVALDILDSFSKIVETKDERAKRRSAELKRFLENEDIKQIFNVIRIEMREAETFFDNFEKYR